MTNLKEFRVLYNKDSDVLYIRAPSQPAEHGLEDEFGIVWRYSSDGRPLGCIVQDFAEYWYPRRAAHLAATISRHLELPENQVEKILAHAASE